MSLISRLAIRKGTQRKCVEGGEERVRGVFYEKLETPQTDFLRHDPCSLPFGKNS